MKYVSILILTLFLTSCDTSSKETFPTEVKNNKFLWTAEWTNGVQENPKEMTKTSYVFLAKTEVNTNVCDENNLWFTAVYKELWVNDYTFKKPVWRLINNERKVVEAKDVLKMVCENEDVTFGIADVNKFPITLRNYPLFQQKNKSRKN
jgi:hypothetical protein